MKNITKHILGLVFFGLILAGCNLPVRPTTVPGIDMAQAGTIVAMTLESLHSATPAVTQTVQVTLAPTSTRTPAATETQTVTITPPYTAPLLSFEGNTNCREGPGKDFKIVIVLHAGQKIEPVGMQGNFWVVKYAKGPETCWVAADFATPSGSTWSIPTMEAPALPTREPPLAPVWSNWKYQCTYATGGSNVNMNLLWINRANAVTGVKVYRDGQIIATLSPDTTSYSESAFLDSGKTMSYYLEVFSDAGKAVTSTITATCQ